MDREPAGRLATVLTKCTRPLRPLFQRCREVCGRLGIDARLLLVIAVSMSTGFVLGIGGAALFTAEAPPPPPPPPPAPVVVAPPEPPPIDFTKPVRPLPPRFPPHTHLPNVGEGEASVSIGVVPFDTAKHLTWLDDHRVWWESDEDSGDDEDDHVMHKSMVVPLRRLIELVCAEGGRLKVQDTYRAEGVHAKRSLHKEGRGIDITCDELGLERLAKLSWAAGFDWVLNEHPKKGGAHVHCSVRP